MRQHLRLAFFIVLLCLSQKALTEVTDNVKVDLTGDVVFSPPLKMETPFANSLASFTAVGIQAALLPEKDRVYPIQFDQIIDVLVIHSPELPELSIQENINHIEGLFVGLDIADTGLENSGVNGRYRIVDIIEQRFFDDKLTQANANAPELLDALNSNNATQFAYQQSGADFIINIANTPRRLAAVASLANVLGTSGEALNKLVVSYPLIAGSAVVHESLRGSIIAHEFGHNLGLSHDRESFPEASTLNDNFIAYGFTDAQRRFSSLMSATPCSSQNCTKSFYSSPDIFVDGIQMGVSESQSNAADASKAVRATFQHAAYFNSRFQSANTVWQYTQDGMVVDWPEVIGADYYLVVERSCAEFDAGFFVNLLENAIQVSQSAALIQNLQNDTEICIVAEKAEIDNQGTGRMFLGGTQLFASDEYIKFDASVVRLNKDQTELSIFFELSDTSIDNNALSLSLFYFAQSNVNENWFDEGDFEAPQAQEVLDAIMDYTFTGEGATRQLTMNLKVPFSEISDAFSTVLELPQFVAPLRLRVGYVNQSDLPISAHFAINQNIPSTRSPKLLSIPKRIENQTSSELSFVIEGVPLGASISLLPEDGLIIEDTNFNLVERGDSYRNLVKATVRTESDLSDKVHIAVMLNGSELHDKITVIPGPLNQPPNLSLEVGSVLTAGAQVLINSNASDADGTIEQFRWSSLRGPLLPDEAVNIENLLIPNAQAGDYRVNLAVLDDKGAIAEQTISFTVTDNSNPPAQNPPDRDEQSGGGSMGLTVFMFLSLMILIRRLAKRASIANTL